MNLTTGSPNGYEQTIYSCDLGEKRDGLYDKGSWSEVLMDGVPLDTILDLELQDKFIDYMNNHSDESEQVMINDRNVDSSVKLSESQHQYLMGNTCGNIREREIFQRKLTKNILQNPVRRRFQK